MSDLSRDTGRPDPEAPSAADVQTQLARILGSPGFVRAPILSRLLTYIVERTLDGAGDTLKEYAIGVEVFGRGAAFDPRTDTIVRVQARRLRDRLKVYYRSNGEGDPIRVDIPVGRYAAVLSRAPLAPAATPESVRRAFESTGAAPRDHHLPVALTSFVGRARMLAEVQRLLRDDAVRLLTLTGAGGCGKTRLALEAARNLSGDFPGGVHLLSLAPLTDAVGVASAVARTLGLRHADDASLEEALPAYARHAIAAPTLLLLDNFEHLLGAAPFVVTLLEASADLKVLVTSRAPLGVYGEHEHVVVPLDLPDPAWSFGDLQRNPAVTLFAQRAAASSGLPVTPDNAAAIAAICRRLDGLPLAIELAAVHTKVLPPEAMLARLAPALDLLVGGPRNVPARQQTLRATLDWSHALLDAPRQALFRRLAVFAGGWTLEGAEAVCNAKGDLGADTIGGVLALADNSLVQRADPVGREARFTMLETVREYALEKLTSSGDEVSTRSAHAAYCIVLAEEGNPRLTAAEREAWLARCDVEHHDFRAALDWMVGERRVTWAQRLGMALFAYWERREHLAEGRRLLLAIAGLRGGEPATSEWAIVLRYAGALGNDLHLHQQALDACRELGDDRGVASQLLSVAMCHRFAGNYAAACPLLEQALAICRRLGDQLEIAASLSNLATAVSLDGDQPRARALLVEAQDLFRSIGDETGVAWSINHLGDVARREGQLAEAQRLYRDAASAFDRLADSWGLARCATDLGLTQCDAGDRAEARASFERALALFTVLRHRRGIARVLEGFAYLAVCEAQYERALALASASRATRDAAGAPRRPFEQSAFEDSLQPAWTALGAAASATWADARRLSLEDAVAFALSDRTTITTRS